MSVRSPAPSAPFPQGSGPEAEASRDDFFLALQTALADEFSIEREFGRGGMGVVYLAREVRLALDGLDATDETNALLSKRAAGA
jgi:hypothetical protein